MSITAEPVEAPENDLQTLIVSANVDSGTELFSEQVQVEAQRDALIHALNIQDTESVSASIHSAISTWLGSKDNPYPKTTNTGETNINDIDGFYHSQDITQVNDSTNGIGLGYQDNGYVRLPKPVEWPQGVSLNVLFENFSSSTSSFTAEACFYYTLDPEGEDEHVNGPVLSAD